MTKQSARLVAPMLHWASDKVRLLIAAGEPEDALA
jgi:hypothetical protein